MQKISRGMSTLDLAYLGDALRGSERIVIILGVPSIVKGVGRFETPLQFQ